MEGWLHGVAGSSFSDEPTPVTALHNLSQFHEAEQHTSSFIQPFLHHTFPRSPQAKPLQPVPTIQVVQSHLLVGSPRQDQSSKKTPEAATQINLGSSRTILAIGPGVWEAGMKLYDVYGLKKAAALYATQPRGRSSSPVDIVTEHGTARWTYITHLIKAYLTFTPPGGKADGRKAHSVSVWLLRQLDPQHHVVKEAGEEVGILVIFLSGTREEEHARRVAELGGPQALAFHPTETKYTFLVHALLQFVDADGIDKLGWTCSVAGKRDDEGRRLISVKGAHVFNPIGVYGESTVNYSLPTGRNHFQTVEITGMNNQPKRYVGARYLGQALDNTPASRAVSAQWLVDTGTEAKFWGDRELIITFE